MKKPTSRRKKPQKKVAPQFPPGWDESRVGRVLAHYENQTDEEAVAEDEAALEAAGQSVMVVPTQLVPEIRALIASRSGA